MKIFFLLAVLLGMSDWTAGSDADALAAEAKYQKLKSEAETQNVK